MALLVRKFKERVGPVELMYSITRTCPFCSHASTRYFSKDEMRSILTEFRPCKEVLCPNCHSWYMATKLPKYCGTFESCINCLSKGIVTLKFKHGFRRIYHLEQCFDTTGTSYESFSYTDDTSSTSW